MVYKFKDLKERIGRIMLAFFQILHWLHYEEQIREAGVGQGDQLG